MQMNKMNRNEKIAVFVAVSFIGFLLFSGPIINFFSSSNTSNSSKNMNSENTNQVATEVITTFKSEDVVIGAGKVAEVGDVITAHYTGTLENNTVFDSSLKSGRPFTFTLGVGEVIRGWDEGILGMREGGKRILTISPEYAYGSNAVGVIPPNSTLKFEVELLSVVKATR